MYGDGAEEVTASPKAALQRDRFEKLTKRIEDPLSRDSSECPCDTRALAGANAARDKVTARSPKPKGL